MNVFELTRALVDIESITNNEERVGHYLYDYLAPLAARFDGRLERIEVEPRASTCSRSGALAHRQRFPPTWIPCLPSSPRATMASTSGARLLRHQGHHPKHDQGRRGAARCRRPQFRPCCSVVGEERTAPAPTRADPNPRGRGTCERRAPPKTDALWSKARCATSGGHRRWRIRLTRAGRSAIHNTGRRAGRYAAHPAARGPAARAEHAQHRHALRRPARPM